MNPVVAIPSAPDATLVRFTSFPGEPHLIHWIRNDRVWKAAECQKKDCPLCFEGHRLQVRVRAEVIEDGIAKSLDMTMPLFKKFEAFYRHRTHQFYDITFGIQRRHTGMVVEFEVWSVAS